MTRRAYVDHSKKIVFFWSQKSGCTTLFQSLRMTYGNENKYYLTNSQKWQDCLPYIKNGYTSVALIRNPMDRILSCYINKFVMHGKTPITSREEMEGFSQKFFDKYKEIHRISTNENTLTFREFLSTISTLFKERKDPDYNTVNGHWDTQTPPGLENKKDFRYDIKFDTEEFETRLKPFLTEKGFTVPTGKSNASPWKLANENHDFLGDLTGAKLSTQHFSKKNLIDTDIAQCIKSLYEVDFRYLDYSSS